ncbi:MAG: T9SS type A sorting domain-containing protein [Lentimicrobiaceae bacterium]|jgi:hypothetical protein|nr:T9SS type A sorting domain-containing protein [Lentimicrobiaceae bacterium]MCP4910229.1 T9SS type A sorting domain-containing protein [Bacteroidota bacterium]MBT3453425.1 T9SS type A sorting domain-containing protein [Lentimicrobiaceae bacterium]MBT3819399.1 T9SS type A sorting domain-containing protein [Lentimicrobiaceae bacterium]MBT4061863.1 T9SS type A sorting domain-containing protein [Lentimicrobiaceae bacterium]
MKNFLQSLIILLAVTFTTQVNGQRYMTEIFDSFVLIEDVTYGVNVSPLISTFPNPTDPAQMAQWEAEMIFLNGLIAASVTNPDTLLSYMNFFAPNSMIPDSAYWTMVKITPLEMDIYTPPASDDVTDRPVWINVHTGNFLPPLFNGAITGNKTDSVGVNICKQMAKRGYVAINVNYRLGWNPISTDPNVRRGTLLQAVYRALHDVQTAVRFMRSPVGAQFGINPDKIALIGQGSGGYVTQAYTTLSDYNTEIAGLAKFINTETGLPFVLEAVDGTIDGGAGFLRLNDPLYMLGLPKDVSMSVNLGGSLADSSWLNQGEVAMVAFHCVRDPYAPFDHGMVVVPTTNENVVPVSGGNVFIRKANEFGNNDAFSSIADGDAYTDAARATYGQTYEYIYASQPEITVSAHPEGLYPFVLPLNGDGPAGVFGNQGSPWDWWDYATLEAVVAATNATMGTDFDAALLNGSGLLSNPDMSQEKGLTYLDTVQGYLQPRAILQLELATGIGESIEVRDAMKIYPNPSVGYVVIENDKADMSEIVFMDGIGRVVFTTEVEGSQYTLNHSGWKTGIYFVTVMFEEGGQLTKKLIIK